VKTYTATTALLFRGEAVVARLSGANITVEGHGKRITVAGRISGERSWWCATGVPVRCVWQVAQSQPDSAWLETESPVLIGKISGDQLRAEGRGLVRPHST
jgi:hypothetical protein